MIMILLLGDGTIKMRDTTGELSDVIVLQPDADGKSVILDAETKQPTGDSFQDLSEAVANCLKRSAAGEVNLLMEKL